MIAGYAGLSAEAIAAAATGSTEGLPDDEIGILAWTDKLIDDHTLIGSDRADAWKFSQ
jgi:4-carboxymuconolactone decarboxylase